MGGINRGRGGGVGFRLFKDFLTNIIVPKLSASLDAFLLNFFRWSKLQTIFKEVYLNICMKIHISSKLTQYLLNIFKTRFLMRNCLKYEQQCQNGIFKKTCRATTVPYSVMWISLDIV